MYCIASGLVFEYTRVRRAELLLVECFAESLGSLFNFLVDLFIELREIIFDQHIGAITLFAVLIIDQRIVKRIDMSGSLPNGRVHKDGRVDPYDILMEQHHAVPPVFFEVVFQFYAVLTVIIYSS